MVAIIALHTISLRIACRPQYIVYAFSSILCQAQNMFSSCAVQFVAFGQRDLYENGSRVNHGEEVVWIVGVESPEVNNLLAMSVTDFDLLTLLNGECHGFACWYDRHLENV